MKLATAVAVFLASVINLQATNYVIFVHGRSGNNCGLGTTDVNSYWGTAKNINTSLTKIFVGYDGASDPRTSGSCRAQTQIYTAMERYCKGTNRCKVICHSAGCYATEYFISKRVMAYNVDWVMASASAAGGSELANMAFWATGGMDAALKTGNARPSYNHNNMQGIGIWAIAGYKGGLQSGFLPGEDDGAVAFHSACGCNSTGSYSNCLSCTRYSYHYIWNGSVNNNNNWNSSKNGYYRYHTGSGSTSINDAMRLEWNDCKAGKISGKTCQ